MKNAKTELNQLTSGTEANPMLHLEIERIIGNARQQHNICVMARDRYGMAEFGRLFYLLKETDSPQLKRYLKLIDEVTESHGTCLRCTIKLVAFSRSFCGTLLPRRASAYGREYARLLDLFGEDRDFMAEVAAAIEAAKPPSGAPFTPDLKTTNPSLAIFPTDIRLFRGDF